MDIVRILERALEDREGKVERGGKGSRQGYARWHVLVPVLAVVVVTFGCVLRRLATSGRGYR